MSSRREEKERRRQERLAAEQARADAQSRRKRLGYVLGGAATVLIVAAIVVLGVRALDTDDATSGASGAVGAAGLPPRQIADLDDAVKAAGCEVESPENEGAGHEEKTFAAADYGSNPPTSGTHFPEWYQDGIYAAGDTPELGKLVHTLEHGRVNLQYRKGTPPATVQRLESLVNDMDGGYHLLLHQNETDMRYAVAATAWDQRLGCPAMNDRVFDAVRAFRDEYIDKGPEKVP